MLFRYGVDSKWSKRVIYVNSSTSGLVLIDTLKVSRKNWNPDLLYEAIINLIEEYKKNSDPPFLRVTLSVESVAYELRAKEKDVKKIFMKLNGQGILTQKRRNFAHDTNRNRFFYGRKSGWGSNVYYLRE